MDEAIFVKFEDLSPYGVMLEELINGKGGSIEDYKDGCPHKIKCINNEWELWVVWNVDKWVCWTRNIA